MNLTEPFMTEARAIARQVLDSVVDPKEGCAAIAALCERNGWPTELTPFSALAHEQIGHEQFGMNSENTAPLIVEECRVLLGKRYEA